jgi:predicted phage tail protein
MQRKVYLVGDLAEKFGSSFTIKTNKYSDVIKCIEANHPSFKKYLIDANNEGIGFTIEVEGKFIEEEKELLLPAREGDITIAAVPAGSKSGGAKIIGALVLAFFILPMIGAYTAAGAAAGYGVGATTTGYLAALTAGFYTTGGYIVASLAVNLAISGLQQIMAPDPSVDNDATKNYLFNGSDQTIVEGDPVPILYGELRVPGRPISIHMSPQGYYSTNDNVVDDDGNLDSVDQRTEKPPKNKE